MDYKHKTEMTYVADDIHLTVDRVANIHPDRLTLPYVTGFGSKRYQTVADAMCDALGNKEVWAAFLKLAQTEAAAEFRKVFADHYVEMWANEVAEVNLEQA